VRIISPEARNPFVIRGLGHRIMRCLMLLSLGCFRLAESPAYGDSQELCEKTFSYTSSVDGTSPLLTTVFYKEKGFHLPVVILLHGYGGKREDLFFSARRIAQQGFFCVVPDLRGSGGSAGSKDDGGLEVMDIYDALKAATDRYAVNMDIAKVSIIGYSAGGAQTYLALVRFPFVFRSALIFFGFPDYRSWIENIPSQAPYVEYSVGGAPKEVPELYEARNAVRAAKNISDVRLHMAVDQEDSLCPYSLNLPFISSVRAAQRALIYTHVSKPGDRNRWIHGPNEAGHLSAMEDLFLNDTIAHATSAPIMPARGHLVIPGFLVTPRFSCFLGRGDAGVAGVDYVFSSQGGQIVLRLMDGSTGTPVRIVFAPDHASSMREIRVDGTPLDSPERQSVSLVLTTNDVRISWYLGGINRL
jgi:dienelactone hydrolase